MSCAYANPHLCPLPLILLLSMAMRLLQHSLSLPFAKAVFEASGGESTLANSNRSVPRRATTAMQQLLYVLGYCEFTMSDDEDGETVRLFEQYRRYVSMNVTALLD